MRNTSEKSPLNTFKKIMLKSKNYNAIKQLVMHRKLVNLLIINSINIQSLSQVRRRNNPRGNQKNTLQNQKNRQNFQTNYKLYSTNVPYSNKLASQACM